MLDWLRRLLRWLHVRQCSHCRALPPLKVTLYPAMSNAVNNSQTRASSRISFRATEMLEAKTKRESTR